MVRESVGRSLSRARQHGLRLHLAGSARRSRREEGHLCVLEMPPEHRREEGPVAHDGDPLGGDLLGRSARSVLEPTEEGGHASVGPISVRRLSRPPALGQRVEAFPRPDVREVEGKLRLGTPLVARCGPPLRVQRRQQDAAALDAGRLCF